MNVLVSGSSGLIGSTLAAELTEEGHQVVRLVRASRGHSEREGEVLWDPDAGVLDERAFDGVEAVVHLAGENVAARWTPAKKAAIHDSRVKGTRLIAQGILDAAAPPRVLVTASGINYYGDRGDAVLDEESAPGEGFLAHVCQEWEAESRAAADAGARVVNLRFGMVLSAQGGALRKMLPPFRMGVGGAIGGGGQYMSWVALEDAVRAIMFALTRDELEGPVNVVSPNPVLNRDFVKTLGHVLGRPTVIPLPAFAARLALGEMADELLLASMRVKPRKLLETGFTFAYPDLEETLRWALDRERRE